MLKHSLAATLKGRFTNIPSQLIGRSWSIGPNYPIFIFKKYNSIAPRKANLSVDLFFLLERK